MLLIISYDLFFVNKTPALWARVEGNLRYLYKDSLTFTDYLFEFGDFAFELGNFSAVVIGDALGVLVFQGEIHRDENECIASKLVARGVANGVDVVGGAQEEILDSLLAMTIGIDGLLADFAQGVGETAVVEEFCDKHIVAFVVAKQSSLPCVGGGMVTARELLGNFYKRFAVGRTLEHFCDGPDCVVGIVVGKVFDSFKKLTLGNGADVVALRHNIFSSHKGLERPEWRYMCIL